MISEYRKEIQLDAPIEVAFETGRRYFLGKGYTLRSSTPPRGLTVEKKYSIWRGDMYHQILDSHDINISFQAVGRTRTSAVIRFLSHRHVGEWTRKSVDESERMINQFISFANMPTASAQELASSGHEKRG